MFKFLYQLGLILEKFERTAPRIFWFLSVVFYTVFVSPYDTKIPPVQVCQYQVVSQQFRAGGQGENLNIIQKMALFFVSDSKRQKPQPQCPVLDLVGLVPLGVTLARIRVRGMISHLVVNGILTTNSIVTTRTKMKKRKRP